MMKYVFSDVLPVLHLHNYFSAIWLFATRIYQ